MFKWREKIAQNKGFGRKKVALSDIEVRFWIFFQLKLNIAVSKKQKCTIFQNSIFTLDWNDFADLCSDMGKATFSCGNHILHYFFALFDRLVYEKPIDYKMSVGSNGLSYLVSYTVISCKILLRFRCMQPCVSTNAICT